MKVEKLLKTSLVLMLASSFVLAGPPSPGVKTFTQPDGTQFDGVLNGGSSFNWIESNGAIIKNNREDKFYYKAVVDANNSLKLTKEKPAQKVNGVKKGIKDHSLSINDRKKLNKLYKKDKAEKGPR